MSLDERLQNIWYGRSAAAWALLPLSWLFRLLVGVRRWAFRNGVLKSIRVARPVIVVGNITVGGTGKTPFVIWLANALLADGRKVAVITRGYGGRAQSWPQRVTAKSDPQEVGDEAVLIAQKTDAVVFAGPDRVAAARQAIAAGAELIVSDDGLQHYRLQRDVELVLVDGSRMLGNSRLLPAGPLREPAHRLNQADLVLLNRRHDGEQTLSIPHLEFRVTPAGVRSLVSGERRTLHEFAGKRVHVVTGIGNPQAFVASLGAQGLQVNARVLADHAPITRTELEFGDSLPVLMTEKDAVKCRSLADDRHWVVEAQVELAASDAARILNAVTAKLSKPTSLH